MGELNMKPTEADLLLAISIKQLYLQKDLHALMVIGPGGLGKSYSVGQALRKQKINHHIISGHITPLELYKDLLKYKDDYTVVFDDCDSLFLDNKFYSIFKTALAPNASGKREIAWKSTARATINVPESFIFDSKIIFILNRIPDSAKFSPIANRTITAHYNLSNDELIEKALEIAKQKSRVLESRKILGILSKNNIKLYDLRTLIQLFDLAKIAKNEDLERFVIQRTKKPSIEEIINARQKEGLRDTEIKHELVSKGLCSERSYYYHKKNAMSGI
jgi:hypothetical protein